MVSLISVHGQHHFVSSNSHDLSDSTGGCPYEEGSTSIPEANSEPMLPLTAQVKITQNPKTRSLR